MLMHSIVFQWFVVVGIPIIVGIIVVYDAIHEPPSSEEYWYAMSPEEREEFYNNVKERWERNKK